MNSDLISLKPYVETYSAPTDSLLVAGMREYSVRQIFSWYFDRPQKICTSNEIFFNQWHTGAYKIAIRYQGVQSEIANDINNEPTVISGNVQLFVNKLETNKVLRIQKNK